MLDSGDGAASLRLRCAAVTQSTSRADLTDSPISRAGNCCGILNGIQIEGVFPVPEPSSVVALCGLCAAGLVVAVRRRVRKAG
jgi:hypothetical protein